MTALQGMQALNALLSLSANTYLLSQRIGPVIEESIRSGKDIPQDEWDKIVAEADASDDRLADVIRRKSNADTLET